MADYSEEFIKNLSFIYDRTGSTIGITDKLVEEWFQLTHKDLDYYFKDQHSLSIIKRVEDKYFRQNTNYLYVKEWLDEAYFEGTIEWKGSTIYPEIIRNTEDNSNEISTKGVSCLDPNILINMIKRLEVKLFNFLKEKSNE